jgi:hypothetical protein
METQQKNADNSAKHIESKYRRKEVRKEEDMIPAVVCIIL